MIGTGNLQSFAILTGIELALVAFVCAALLALLRLMAPRTSASQIGLARSLGRVATVQIRKTLIASGVLAGLAIIGYNAWLFTRSIDAKVHAVDVYRSITPATWTAIGIGFAKLGLIPIAVLIVTRLARRLLKTIELTIAGWEILSDEHHILPKLFAGLNRVVVKTGWLLGAVFACQLLSAPAALINALLVITRVYIVIAVAIAVIRSSSLIVGVLDALGQRYALRRGWSEHYDHLHSLLPTFRTCLDYALWVGFASLVLFQIPGFRTVAAWGPLVMQAIGILLVGRAVVELGYLELGRRMLPHEGLEESVRRRRATMLPLVRSTFTYAAYFATAVLILSALGFNPLPFLAGAGILGLVVGFGAQSMINDVVSGFFILFENTYLVGDTIEAAGARGVVEAIEFRTTKVRDSDGRMHIIRNGDMKLVVNYSKDYAVAARKSLIPENWVRKTVIAQPWCESQRR